MELPDKSHPPRRQKRKEAPLRMGIMLSTAGLELGVAVAIGAFAGQYLDEYFSTETPWFTMALLLAGISAGFLNLYRLVNRAKNKYFNESNDDNESPFQRS